ncbi:hypothetical protein P4O66_023069, partial [Electrophorus voltai]
FGDGPFLFQHDCAPVHKARYIKTWMSEFGVEELDCPAQSSGLNPIEHVWDELEWSLQARPSRPTAVSDLTNALLDKCSKIHYKHTPKSCRKPSQKSRSCYSCKGHNVVISPRYHTRDKLTSATAPSFSLHIL